MKKDDLLRIDEQFQMWERVGFNVWPIARPVVAATLYDPHIVAAGLENEFRARAKKTPWAGSGHYGKELNLMVSGEKRVAYIGGDSISGWLRYLDDRTFVALIDGPSLSDYVIMRREDLRFADAVLESLIEDAVSAGVVLGYHPEDIVRCARSERKWLANSPGISDEDHEALLSSLELPAHLGFDQWWVQHDMLASAKADGWTHIRRENGGAWRRNTSASDDDPYWTYAMERERHAQGTPI